MPKFKIQPVGDRILVQRAKAGEQLRGGVIIPDSATEEPQEARVLAVGSGTKSVGGTVSAFEVKVGDTVLIGGHAGSNVEVGDQKFTLVREDDILGVIA
jgi:chaperonin GroES